MTLIETIVGVYRAEIWIVTNRLVINSWHGTKSVHIEVELAYDKDPLIHLYNLLEDTSTPYLVILRNAVVCIAFINFALLANNYQGWALTLL
jgi:hypothetical protein